MLYAGKKNTFSLHVISYKLQPNRSLKSYLRPGKEDLLQTPMMMTVSRSWLKNYLDWIHPDLFQYILAHTDGVQVTCFVDQLAAEDDVD